MKKLNLTFEGGFPIKDKTFNWLQDISIEIIKAIAGHFGMTETGNYIISGCEIVGTNIKPGIMYIDGDVCTFTGIVGDATTKIAKIITTETAAYKNGIDNPSYETIIAGEYLTGLPFSEFIRVPKINELINELTDWYDIKNLPNVVIDPINPVAVPPEKTVIERLVELEKKNKVFQAGGAMVLWNKPFSAIPAGWHEVIDWKGRIPVGIDDSINSDGTLKNPEFGTLIPGQIVPGREGGDKSKTLDKAEMPPHRHRQGGQKGYTNNFGAHGTFDQSLNGPDLYSDFEGGKPDGSTKAFSLLNPFRTVLFIEYTGI